MRGDCGVDALTGLITNQGITNQGSQTVHFLTPYMLISSSNDSLSSMTEKEANPLFFSSSSESLPSTIEKSTMDNRAGKIPQRTRSMENLHHGRSNIFYTTNKSPSPKAWPKTQKVFQLSFGYACLCVI